MQHDAKWQRGLLVGLVGLMVAASAAPATPPPPDRHRGIQVEGLKPQWHVGDRWIVETTSLQTQVADAEKARTQSKPVRWEFSVQAVENLAGQPCYRLQVQVQVQSQTLAPKRKQPVTTLWVDCRSLALRQLQTQLPTPGGYKTVTESYRSAGAEPTPVIGPLSVLPIDLPVFLGGRTKGSETFTYESIVGEEGVKAVGDVGFAYQVQQDFSRPAPEQIKGLLSDTFTKDLQSRPVVEVRLKTVDRQVRQFWQPGRPWPIYSDNGTTTARLIQVMPASPPTPEEPEVQQ